MKSYILTFVMAFLAVFGMRAAEVVTTSPSPLQESSSDVVVYFHADQGTKGMMGLASSAQVYAHTGVVTDKSAGTWVYAPSKWGDNSAKYKLEYVSPNLWKLNIGDIRSYYGVPAGEKILKLAFVFRTADCSKEGKETGGKDIFVDVLEEGFQLSFWSDMKTAVVTDAQKTVNFTLTATQSCKLSMSVNGSVVKSADGVSTLTVPYTFNNKGNYTVVATAEKGGEKVEQTLNVCYPSTSVAGQYPGGVPRQGAVKNSDGSVTFCLAAPGKSSAMIVPSWDNYAGLEKNVMKYQDYQGNRYFWITVNGLDNTTRYNYYYLVDGTYRVGDPYAKLIRDPYSDKYIDAEVFPGLERHPEEIADVVLGVYQGNINDYKWKVENFKGVDKKDLVIYELLLRDFTGTEGASEGNGTLRKAMEKISYLKTLGVNAIELMPIMEFNGNNSWGYNTNFYFAPDKAYGTPDDYKAFIDLCHENGIAVILDIVFNQSDGLHPWYQLYDIASNPFYNKNAPHAYSVLNDWKQDHPLVAQQWEDVVKYWLKEYKVDGFRFDLVKGLGDNNSYGGGTEAFNQSRVNRMKKIHAAMQEVNPNAYFINENLASASEENAMAADGQLNWANVNNSACQFAMGYTSESNLNRFNATMDSRTWGSTVSYAESHDEERVGYKQNAYGAAGVKGNKEVSKRRIGSLAAQMILAPGAHMIWQFSELGNDETTKNGGNNNTDPKKVNWDALKDPVVKGLYDNWCELIGLRTSNPDLFAQNASYTMQVGTGNWANGRYIYASNTSKELICVINPNVTGDRTFNANFKQRDNSVYSIASHSYNTNPTFDAVAGTVTVPANSYVVLVNNKVSAVEDIVADAQKVEVYAVGNEIVINGEYSNVEVYNASGMRFPTLTVPSGIYLVRVDGETHKVAVR